jgi:hypothetical protein
MSGARGLKSAGTKAKAATAAGKVKVRIAERCVFYVGERAYYAGQEVELAKHDADALLRSGQAEPLGRRSRRAEKPAEPEAEPEPST